MLYELVNLASVQIMNKSAVSVIRTRIFHVNIHNIKHLPAISQSCNLILCVSDTLIIFSAKSTPTVPL